MPLLRTDHPMDCDFCGQEFTPVKRFNSQARFCSPSWGQMAYKKRKRISEKFASMVGHKAQAILEETLTIFIPLAAVRCYTHSSKGYEFTFCSLNAATFFQQTLAGELIEFPSLSLKDWIKVSEDGIHIYVSAQVLNLPLLLSLINRYNAYI